MGASEGTALTKSATIQLRFYLLGAFSVTLVGQPLALPPRRVQTLLAALLLDPRPWRREQLAGRLFPEASERRARQRVSHTLWQTRRWLPTLSLETTPETVFLPPDVVWLDARAFHEAASGKDPAAWLEALALYRGDLLAGIYEDWLLEEREATYLRYVHLSHRTCDVLWQRGEIETLLPIAERLVQHEPLDEHALRTLMRTYQALGRRGAALAACDRCATVLLDEIGLELEPATRALAEAIRTTPAAHAGALFPDAECARAYNNVQDHALGPDPHLGATALVDETRNALLRGYAQLADDRMAALRLHPNCDTEALHLLEIDRALFVEDFALATALLGPDDEAATSSERLRRAQLAFATHDLPSAERLAAEVLVASRADVPGANGHNREAAVTEIEALLILARAQQGRGEHGHAALSFERALLLARRIGYPHGVIQALLIDGQGRVYQGRYSGAGTCFREARAVALEYSMTYDLAVALQGLQTVLSHTNALGKALETAKEELSLWRDLGLEQREAATLEGIATIQNHLGRSVESLRTMAQAQVLSDRCDDPMRTANNRYHLACAMIYHNDALAQKALEVAQQALDTYRTHGQLGWEARVLEIIGYTLWVDGRHAAALDALCEAEAATRRMGELAYLPELLAYQGLAQVKLGHSDKALSCTHQAITLLAQGGVSDEVVPEILYAHAEALAANGRPAAADRYLKQAYGLLLAGAAVFEEDAARQAFFHRNPTMRRLIRELQARGIAPPPDAVVQTVQLHTALGDGTRRVNWTVDAGPADAALEHAEGAIALRRVRLARLRTEARDQGCAPTVSDLAGALQVSERTIQRDLAALRV